MNRRLLMQFFLGAFAAITARVAGASSPKAGTPRSLHKSKSEWASLLPPSSYRVLFEEGTELPGSSALNHEKRDGTFVCAACFLPLFDSTTKYDSGTGWPSFWQPLSNALGTKVDYALLMRRTEYHCVRCGGHQGHVFDDGPPPSGKRYCNNGVALRFIPRGDKLPDLRV